MHRLPSEPLGTGRKAVHPLLAALLIVLGLTLLWDGSGADMWVMQWFGTPQGFALRHQWWLQTVLHDGLRRLCTGLWAGLALWALWPALRQRWYRSHIGPLDRRPGIPSAERLWVCLLVGASVLAVNAIKFASHTSCPWDLSLFGGQAPYVSHWNFTLYDHGPGHCFPSGHALSGFAFVALCLPWLMPPKGAVRPSAPGWCWLALACAIGTLAGAVQTLRGAHYPSHVLWTLLICSAIALMGWKTLQWASARRKPSIAA